MVRFLTLTAGWLRGLKHPTYHRAPGHAGTAGSNPAPAANIKIKHKYFNMMISKINQKNFTWFLLLQEILTVHSANSCQ